MKQIQEVRNCASLVSKERKVELAREIISGVILKVRMQALTRTLKFFFSQEKIIASHFYTERGIFRARVLGSLSIMKRDVLLAVETGTMEK